MKAVFTTKVSPTYDDLPEERYHFPRTYLGPAEAAVGDWVVYYEPRRTSGEPSSRGGRQAYFAIAHLDRIERDTTKADHFYGLVSQFLAFDQPVPFRQGNRYYEARLRRVGGGTSKGAFGRAVRSITDTEFEAIVKAGFAPILQGQLAKSGIEEFSGIQEEPKVFDRPILESIVTRPFRDAAFAVAVKAAYGATCAVTGLRIINGGGRSEVQAAHIRPVADRGPDSVRNGVALCGTVHWMFDRGLISFGDDYSVLVAQQWLPEGALKLLRPGRRLLLPNRPDLRPHVQFLQYHRVQVFKS
jgi:putative restriction endonuclease